MWWRVVLIFLLTCGVALGFSHAPRRPIVTAGGGSWAFLFTADHGSGTNYALTNGGSSSLAGTWSGTAATDAQNHTTGGTYSVDVAGANDQIYFQITGGDIFDQEEYRLEICTYLPATLTGNSPLFELTVDGVSNASNSIYAQVYQNGTVYLRNEGNDVVSSVTSTAVVISGWNCLRFRSSVANDVMGIKVNGNAWEVDSDADPVTAPAISFNRLTIGEGVFTGMADHVYLDDVTSYTSYDASWDGE